MKVGDIITLKDGTKLEIQLNLIQILTGVDSCEGCYFRKDDPKDDCGDADQEQAPSCGSKYADADQQVIFKEVKDESRRDPIPQGKGIHRPPQPSANPIQLFIL